VSPLAGPPTMQVGVVEVALTTLLTFAVGWAVLVLAARRSRRWMHIVMPAAAVRRSLALLAIGPMMVVGLIAGSTVQASAAESENASCVEKFNVAVGTPGEFQRVFHQKKLGRDVSRFARLGDDCPFPP